MIDDQLLQGLGDAQVAAIAFAPPDLLLTFALAGAVETRTLRFTWACDLHIEVDQRTTAEPKGAPQMLVWEVTATHIDANTRRLVIDCAQQGSITFRYGEVRLEPRRR
jgi:hypothetical protein